MRDRYKRELMSLFEQIERVSKDAQQDLEHGGVDVERVREALASIYVSREAAHAVCWKWEKGEGVSR